MEPFITCKDFFRTLHRLHSRERLQVFSTIWEGENFLSTEFLSELGKQGNGALYVRSFADPAGGLNGLVDCPGLLTGNQGYHNIVLTNTDVQKAIWETFT